MTGPLTADSITDIDLRGLLYAYTFQTPTWNDADAALSGYRSARERCAFKLEALARHAANTGNNSNVRSPSMDARTLELINARRSS